MADYDNFSFWLGGQVGGQSLWLGGQMPHAPLDAATDQNSKPIENKVKWQLLFVDFNWIQSSWT